MKFVTLFTFLLLFIFIGNAQLNIDSISHLPVNTMHNQDLNDVWGYVDGVGNEYGLIGGTKGTSVVDLSDPTNPVEVFFQPGLESIWRDIKTFGNYAYVTTEAMNGLTIIDLTSLPGGATISSTFYTGPSGNEWFSAHNLYIDESGYCYIFGANRGNGGVIILDLTDPVNPVEVGTFDNWYVHDGYVENDTMYIANIYEGYFSVVDVTDKANPQLLGTQDTPSFFAHNIWGKSNQFAFTTDEVYGGFIGSYDVSDPTNIIELDKIQSYPGVSVIPHNTHVLNNYIVTSYYANGVTVHDVTHPNNLVEVGNFDTYNGTGAGYVGCWGVYPFLPSGLILATDITGGFFVLDPNYTQAAYLEGVVTDNSNSNPIQDVEVTIAGNNYTELTRSQGDYATGVATSGVFDVTYFKPGYYPQTISVSLQNGVVTTQDVQLEPIPPFALNVNVVDAITNSPIENAQIELKASVITHNGLTNAIGSESFSLFYEETYFVTCGVWGYRTYCNNLVIDANTGTITIELEKGYYDDFTFDFGWSILGNVDQGEWVREEPFGTSSGSNPEIDAANDCNDICYVTGNEKSIDPNLSDIVNGETLLRSPSMDLSGMSDPYLLFDYWFYNFHGPNPPDDTLRVFLSDGTQQVEVFKVGSNMTLNVDWLSSQIRITDYIGLTNNMMLSVSCSDLDPNVNITEAAFDHFQIVESQFLSIEDKESEVRIYPNPVNDELIVNGITGNYVVYSSIGQKVAEGILNLELSRIDVSHMAEGIYILKIQDQTIQFVVN